MRKYTETALIYFKAQLIWRADTVFNMLFTVTKIIFAYVLWGAIFEGPLRLDWSNCTTYRRAEVPLPISVIDIHAANLLFLLHVGSSSLCN